MQLALGCTAAQSATGLQQKSPSLAQLKRGPFAGLAYRPVQSCPLVLSCTSLQAVHWRLCQACERPRQATRAAALHQQQQQVTIQDERNAVDDGNVELVPVELREAIPADVRRLLHIERSSFPKGDHTPHGFMRMSIENQHKEEYKETSVLVAEINGKIEAYTVAWLVGDELQVIDLAVDRAWRRQGLGKLLMERLVKMCLRDPPLKVILEVRASNAAALQLYASLGYEITGRRKNYYHHPQEDGILLMQVLQDSVQQGTNPA
ncbi:hypothetical protein WJX74_010181 [Apatococcus lobatus]|uniref:N-acetyltransferase domain-containing protein n=1 Tax=Apatococcus lobatus TaxID=904363 RepID=A0AAW1QVQ7_9CHLO